MEEFLNQLKEDFDDVSYEFETISIKVNVENWISSHEQLRDKFDLKYFSWLYKIIWLSSYTQTLSSFCILKRT